MMSGSSAASRSSLTSEHAANGSSPMMVAPVTATSRARLMSVRMSGSPAGLEANGETCRVIRLRPCGEQRLLRVELAVVLLGVDAGPVGEQRDVARGEVDAGPTHANQPAGEVAAHLVRGPDLANPPEIRLLEVAHARGRRAVPDR